MTQLTKSDIDSLICAVDFLTYNSDNIGVHDRSKTLLVKLHELKKTAKDNQ